MCAIVSGNPFLLKDCTYHVVGNDGQMSIIDSDTIHSENARPVESCIREWSFGPSGSSLHFLDDRSSRSFYTIRLENGKDVVRVNLRNVDEILGHTPDGGQI